MYARGFVPRAGGISQSSESRIYVVNGVKVVEFAHAKGSQLTFVRRVV